MRILAYLITIMLTLASTSAVMARQSNTGAAAATLSPAIIGTWVNPHQSVHVRTGGCNNRLCGWIVWASPEALSDARDSGVERLVGTTLLQNYVADDRAHYHGQVFVPDMGRSFSSTIRQIDANTLTIKGCLIGGMICKTQIWRRVTV